MYARSSVGQRPHEARLKDAMLLSIVPRHVSEQILWTSEKYCWQIYAIDHANQSVESIRLATARSEP